MPATLNRAQVAALLAVAQDYAFGQPPGSQLRAALIAQRLGGAAGLDSAELATTWWTSALRFLGCTGHAYETAVVFGDEIRLRAESLQADGGNPPPNLHDAMEMNFRTACEVADTFAARLGVDESVRAALAANFERWNGRGFPRGLAGDAIPRQMRIAQLSQELEVLVRVQGLPQALKIVAARAGGAHDPGLADLVVRDAGGWWAAVEAVDAWDAALVAVPGPAPLNAADVHSALLVVADFADLKSPWTSGHSRTVAALAGAVAGSEVEAAGLVHDLGRVAVPNSVWDKPGPLTRDERDRAETHSLVTDQLLRRLDYTRGLAGTAAAAHERLDGSGYHRRLGAAQLDDAARVIAVADCYAAMTAERPHRPALEPAAVAGELRTMSSRGRLDGAVVERVLAAAGQRPAARPTQPAGLTSREVEVLKLISIGLTTRQVAERLVISPKTADHHVQHVYTKIGVSTRGAATLFAIERGILP